VKAYLPGVASALLYVAGYPAGLGLWPLSCVALVPLLYATERGGMSTSSALRVGSVFAVLTQLIGYAFLPETLLRFSGLPLIACYAVHLALCVAQGAGMVVFVAVSAWLRRRGRSALLFAPALWVAIELVWPSLFEAPLGAAMHDVAVLIQGAELGGVALVSLLVASINACVAALSLGIATGDDHRIKRALVGLGLAGCAVGAGHARVVSLEADLASGPALRIGLVQANLSAEAKRRDPLGYAERYVGLSQHITDPIDLLIWPETALAEPIATGAASMAQAHPSLQRVQAPLLVGAVTYERSRLYNSALLFGADRQRVGRIDKHKLLPFAEILPFGERLPVLYDWIPGAGRFTAGVATPVLKLGTTTLAVFICYEDMLAETVRRATIDGRAQLLVGLSNDAWFGESRAAYTHFAVARMRAVELRRTLVRATNTGVTAVVAPTGASNAQWQAAEHTQATLIAPAPLLETQTLYARFGQGPLVGLLLLWLAVAWNVRARQLSGQPSTSPASLRARR